MNTPPSISSRRSSTSHHNSETDYTPPPSSPISLQSPKNNNNKPTAMDGRESLLRFLLLPSQVGIVLLLEFLNSFRSFGLRFVQYTYITNEFGISDTKAGALLGVKGIVDIVFGLAGSILVDIFGVRRVSVVALSVAIIGRTLLAFGRTTTALYPALFFFSPFGDALLSVGLYKVALKKLTTPLTRPLSFALSYASFNLAGAFADILVDKMRGSFEDLNIEYNFIGVSGIYTPMRQFMVVTWLCVLLTWLVAYCFLDDLTVIDTNDLEEDEATQRQNSTDVSTLEDSEGYISNGDIHIIPAKSMVKPHILRKWFPSYYQTMHIEEENNDTAVVGRRLPNYQMFKTQYGRSNSGPGSQGGENNSTTSGLYNQLCVLLRMRATWRVLTFGFASFTIAMNWTAGEMILPPFLERRFGEDIPIYTIQSINLFGCLILPPIVGALTSGYEDFSIVMPGLWIMASSPIFVALSPTAFGCAVWQVFLTLGEVLWSPRQLSWTASLAPTGLEGLFFAVSSARSVMGPLTDFVMGKLNQELNANCPDCRDKFGHFCKNLSDENNLQCISAQESCDIFLENNEQSCPSTCLECPTYEATNPSTVWWLLMLASLMTPVCIWFFLPFLRGYRNRDDHFYGILSCNKNRLFGICGAAEDEIDNNSRPQLYGQVDGESFAASEATHNGSSIDDVELT